MYVCVLLYLNFSFLVQPFGMDATGNPCMQLRFHASSEHRPKCCCFRGEGGQDDHLDHDESRLWDEHHHPSCHCWLHLKLRGSHVSPKWRPTRLGQ